MDIYGYSLYQYNQSDELAKQLLAQQSLSSLPQNRDVSEPHIMPAPSGAPWNVQGVTWGMQSPPQLVQFTAQSDLIDHKISPVVHCKRKSLDVEPVIPPKQLITEEKMAAHLNGLHISSDFTSHTQASEECMDLGMEVAGPTPISEKLRGHTIVLSEEVKKIREEPLLPAALIERLEKPRMSLVLWKPRENIVEKLKDVDEEKKEEVEEVTFKKRNGVLVTELPVMDVEM